MNNDLTVVFGYSDNKERYSYKASQLLKEFEHSVFNFNPRVDPFELIPKSFHTLTLYVNPEISSKFKDQFLTLKFKRVIFNPGTENEILIGLFKNLGVEVVLGCTLVMLRTDQY
jgi:predicted CoA-binding protein